MNPSKPHWRVPGGGAEVGTIVAPMAGLGLGALIGSSVQTTQSSSLGGATMTSSTPKGVGIGSVVGPAAGGVVSIVLLSGSRQFFVEGGAPMEMTFPQPVTLAENQVADAVVEAQEHPVAPIPVVKRPSSPPASTNRGTCYTPGTPGTPPIPGAP